VLPAALSTTDQSFFSPERIIDAVGDLWLCALGSLTPHQLTTAESSASQARVKTAEAIAQTIRHMYEK
jgi:hypothetical protein